MFDPPQTIEEARAYRYGAWGGNPKGNPYRPERCAYEVNVRETLMFHQCYRKNGYGVNHLYCKQHSKFVGE